MVTRGSLGGREGGGGTPATLRNLEGDLPRTRERRERTSPRPRPPGEGLEWGLLPGLQRTLHLQQPGATPPAWEWGAPPLQNSGCLARARMTSRSQRPPPPPAPMPRPRPLHSMQAMAAAEASEEEEEETHSLDGRRGRGRGMAKDARKAPPPPDQ